MISIIKSIKGGSSRKFRNLAIKLLMMVFILMSYFYISEVFGSVSSPYLTNSSFEILFGITLLLYTFFSIVSGPALAFISGFLGELFYQLAFYDTAIIYWCLFVGFFGLINGFYKYRPLKYQKLKGLGKTMFILIVNSIIFMSMVVSIRIVWNPEGLTIQDILINFGLKLFVQCLLSIVILIPFALFIYDKILSSKERHIYNIFLTHHPMESSDHTFRFQFGRTYVYLCSRCSGMIIGLIISIFSIHLVEKIYDSEFDPFIALILVIILPIPGLIDWGTQRLLLRKSTSASRIFTGFIIGVAMNLVSFTGDYYFITLLIITVYFGILFFLIYFGQKRLLRRLEEELIPESPEKQQEPLQISMKEVGIIFIHGLESSGEGFKARYLRDRIPGIITPTFEQYNPQISIDALLQRRMMELDSILDSNPFWIIIGSSFGGLMAALYAMKNPKKINKLILLAPYLTEKYLPKESRQKIDIPVVIYHGLLDTVVNPTMTRKIAVNYFNNLLYHLVEDDHSLQSTVQILNWEKLTCIN